MIVSFVIGKLLSGQSGPGAVAQSGGLDLGGLLNHMGSDQGLDADTATRGLQEVFHALGGQMSQR
jgi:hypothetical protein